MILLWMVSLFVSTLSAQTNTQIIVVGLLKTDRTFHRTEELFLETRVARDQIVYAYDSSSKQFVVKEYVRESGYNLWDGEHTVKEKHKTRTPHFSNPIPEHRFQHFLNVLEANVESLPQYYGFLHTSHYYLNVYVNVVVAGDTTTWHKSQPFECSTPWQGPGRTLLDPAIDAFVVAMLPKRFVGRGSLANPQTPTTEPTSMFGAAPLARDRNGKPRGMVSIEQQYVVQRRSTRKPTVNN